MKAAIYAKYGPPDVVQIADVEKPVPKDDEVLIKVHAASVNPLDWHYIRGTPYVIHLLAGLRKPKDQRLGVDVAGEVEVVGKNVIQLKPGDAVFGSCHGAFAEYVCTSELAVVVKPDNVTFEQAAAVPVAAYTALQGLRDRGKIQPGQKVLINGAAGGVGTFAVQIAKSYGAEVTAICSTRNVDMVQSLGATHVIDYTQTDFTKSAQRYDIFFDLVANHSLAACTRVLNPQGTYIPAGGEGGRWMARALARGITTLVLSRFLSQKLVAFFMAQPSKEDLNIMRELLQSGRVTPVIDRSYKLNEVSAAIGYLETRHARGKVVITLLP